MKSLLALIFVICSINISIADQTQNPKLSTVISIDDYDYGKNYVQVSEEGLPGFHYNLLQQLVQTFQFTLMTDESVNSFFENMKKDSRARNRIAGGKCSTRRTYIQNVLKKANINSGKLFIHCPANNGHMRLQDQVTGHNYHFANFHDVNIVAVNTPSGIHYRVLDVQFMDKAVSLHDYLSVVEASQRIRPIKQRGTSKGLCYWSVSTNKFRY